MDEIVMKDEFYIKNRCRTCLSIGRKLKPIGEYCDIFKKIITECNLQQDMLQALVCWECEAILRNARRFQRHVQKANKLLQSQQENYAHGTLSNLTTILINETHPNVIYVTEQDIKVDIDETIADNTDENFECEDITIKTESLKEDKQENTIKKTNRWALKRAEKNKKPKFKIIDNVDCFRKVQMSDEEMRRTRGERDSDIKSKFVCRPCEIGFSEDSLLVKHEKQCHSKSIANFICDICKKRYIDKRHLAAHIRKHYDKYSCTICSYVCYGEKVMKRHTQVHRRVFECIKCGLRFGCRREFYKHFKEWHEKYICDHCGISFKMRYCIKDHIRKQHSPYECKPCNKRFARYGGLWLHNKTTHSTQSARAYCVECDTQYVDVYRYRWHLNNSARHNAKTKRRIPCPDCEKVFTKNIYMRDHHNLVHLKNYKYRCEECDKNFIRNADLVRHRRRVHEGILPARNKICYMCGRGFTTNKILSNHVRTHTGERPFACACGARFAQAAARDAHARARGHAPCT